jgi:hypothetical protein
MSKTKDTLEKCLSLVIEIEALLENTTVSNDRCFANGRLYKAEELLFDVEEALFAGRNYLQNRVKK